MAYQFAVTADYIDYTTNSAFTQLTDLAIGGWFNFPAGSSDDFVLIRQDDSFPVIQLTTIADITYGYGVRAEHIRGGGTAFGVHCLPGQVDSRFMLNPGNWMYFGFSRDAVTRTYYSWFGSRTALIDGPTFGYTPGQDPIPAPPNNIGPWRVGNQAASLIGPAHYWSRKLSKSEHLQMAQCTLPALTLGLIWWTKMFQGATDLSPNNWPPTFGGNPVYIPDNGCASFSQGQDYRAYYGE